MVRKPVKSEPGGAALVVEWENRKHVIQLADVTGRQVREFRETTGLSWTRVVTGKVEYDIDVAAALVWFAHHVNGRPASYAALLDGMNSTNWAKAGTSWQLAPPSADDGDDDPNR